MNINLGGFGIKGGDIKKLLAMLAGEGDEAPRKVKKSIPAKKEWVRMHDEMKVKVDKAKKMVKAVEEVMEDLEADRKKWWATIELGMDDFTTDKQFNEDTNEVEILADREDKVEKKNEPIKSPFQTKPSVE